MPKLLQLNMWSGRLEKQIANFIEKEQPDILCLQEVISFDKKDAAMFLTVEHIQTITGAEYVTMAPVFSFRFMNGTAKFGNAIVSRYPIKKSEVVFTRLDHKEDFDFNDHDYNIRNFIHAEIVIEDRLFHVVTHHGHHVKEHKDGNDETQRQMTQLAQYVSQLEGPIILTGDFNLRPHSESLKLLNKQLRNLSIAHKLKTTRNNLTPRTEVCDYIFINDTVHEKNFKLAKDVISDHQALILEFN